MPEAPPPAETLKSGSESRDPDLRSSDPENTEVAKAADVDKSTDADLEADALVSPPTPGAILLPLHAFQIRNFRLFFQDLGFWRVYML